MITGSYSINNGASESNLLSGYLQLPHLWGQNHCKVVLLQELTKQWKWRFSLQPEWDETCILLLVSFATVVTKRMLNGGLCTLPKTPSMYPQWDFSDILCKCVSPWHFPLALMPVSPTFCDSGRPPFCWTLKALSKTVSNIGISESKVIKLIARVNISRTP